MKLFFKGERNISNYERGTILLADIIINTWGTD